MTLLDLAVKIGVDDQASGAVSRISEHLGNGLKRAAQVGIAAVTAASAAIVKLSSDSIKAYSEYEQLAGGAQKIFDKVDYSKIKRDADNAYKNMGLSANEYLRVINDVGATFAASMGDEAGYETAQKGLQAISDYASGTGKSVDELSSKFTLITRSTSSYQSIADQFSGILPATTQDFLKQAQAAGFLSETYTKLTEVPVAEYQKAVSDMLDLGVEKLGLSANTYKESETTISGSLNAMKKSWENLKTGISDENSEIDKLLDNFILSAENAANNLADRALVTIDKIKGIFEDPEQRQKFIDLGKEIFEKIIKGLTDDEYAKANLAYVSGWLAGSLYEALSDAINAAWNLIKGTATDEDFGTDFTRGLMHGSETLRNSGQFSWGYGTNDTREGPSAGRGNTTVPELQGTLLPTPGKTPTVGDMTFNITYANPNSNPREIGEAVQTLLEEAEAANG